MSFGHRVSKFFKTNQQPLTQPLIKLCQSAQKIDTFSFLPNKTFKNNEHNFLKDLL